MKSGWVMGLWLTNSFIYSERSGLTGYFKSGIVRSTGSLAGWLCPTVGCLSFCYEAKRVAWHGLVECKYKLGARLSGLIISWAQRLRRELDSHSQSGLSFLRAHSPERPQASGPHAGEEQGGTREPSAPVLHL